MITANFANPREMRRSTRRPSLREVIEARFAELDRLDFLHQLNGRPPATSRLVPDQRAMLRSPWASEAEEDCAED